MFFQLVRIRAAPEVILNESYSTAVDTCGAWALFFIFCESTFSSTADLTTVWKAVFL